MIANFRVCYSDDRKQLTRKQTQSCHFHFIAELHSWGFFMITNINASFCMSNVNRVTVNEHI